jgi:hypothetical protein
MFMHSVHQVLFARIQTSYRKRWEYAAAADVGQRSIIFTRGRRNILGQQLYSFWKRQSKEIN